MKETLAKETKEALFYEKLTDDKLKCLLCPQGCVLKDNQTGICKARKNIGVILVTLNYNYVSSVHVDPIEKKPLYNFYPGADILSLGTLGCNLSCFFCQNWSISQASSENGFSKDNCLPPEKAVQTAEKLKSKGNIGLAYTYNEPFIWYEYVLETAQLAHSKGLKNVLVTNGTVNEEPLRNLLPYIDALNVDIKSINPSYYQKYCKSTLEPVLNTCKIAKDYGCHLEITNLVVSTLNDSESDIQKLIDWVAENLGKDTPLHFSRYHPDYQCELPATRTEALEMAYELGTRKLNYVYVGNIWADKWNHTYCPSCKKIVINRAGFQTREINLKHPANCRFCGEPVAVVLDSK